MEEGRGISDKAFHDRHSFDTRRRGEGRILAGGFARERDRSLMETRLFRLGRDTRTVLKNYRPMYV